jgi:DNA-3-methyladenine glycosylase I
MGWNGAVTEPRTGDVVIGDDGLARCWWCVGTPEYRRYHDDEWGRPVADDHALFEKLALEGFMSGLSWLTILRKRENFRRAFRDFDVEAVARFSGDDVERLLTDKGIVRSRAKIEATINNAGRCEEIVDERGSLAAYAWSYEPPQATGRATGSDGPAGTTRDEAVAMSKDLKRRGWRFVGPTTVFSFMQAVGLVNDHVSMCEWRATVDDARAVFRRPAG